MLGPDTVFNLEVLARERQAEHQAAAARERLARAARPRPTAGTSPLAGLLWWRRPARPGAGHPASREAPACPSPTEALAR